MKKKLLLLALSLSTVINAESLKDTVDEVLTTNPIVLERLKNYNMTKEDITTAKAGYYPKLDLSLGTGFEHTEKKILLLMGLVMENLILMYIKIL